MDLRDQLLDALRQLSPPEQRKVLEFAQRLRSSVSNESAYAKAKRLGIVGIMKDAPPDLSTQKTYFAGFGRERSRMDRHQRSRQTRGLVQ